MVDNSNNKKPKLSVVVASQNARETILECVRSIGRQSKAGEVEIIVVDNSTDDTDKVLQNEFQYGGLIEADTSKLIPELWGIGIRKCTGDYIALTTAHFIPAENWIDQIIQAQKRPFAGIGGAIENGEKEGLVSWAIYFCRYSHYMLPFDDTEVADFAADNASYKRVEMEKLDIPLEDGFWETFAHKEMSDRGMQLLKTPDIVVHHRKSFSFSGFMKQRFAHGKHYGSSRTEGLNPLNRASLIVLSPLIPALYLFRILRAILTKKRNLSKLILSSPILTMFLLSWSVGEFSGYLVGSGNTKDHK